MRPTTVEGDVLLKYGEWLFVVFVKEGEIALSEKWMKKGLFLRE